jgi:hypothetical protein
MNRRDLLLLRVGGEQVAVLSCEQLYMRYVDALSEGTTARLFDNLANGLRTITTLRLTEGSWLACDELKRRLDAVLAGFSESGGRIERVLPIK